MWAQNGKPTTPGDQARARVDSKKRPRYQKRWRTEAPKFPNIRAWPGQWSPERPAKKGNHSKIECFEKWISKGEGNCRKTPLHGSGKGQKQSEGNRSQDDCRQLVSCEMGLQPNVQYNLPHRARAGDNVETNRRTRKIREIGYRAHSDPVSSEQPVSKLQSRPVGNAILCDILDNKIISSNPVIGVERNPQRLEEVTGIPLPGYRLGNACSGRSKIKFHLVFFSNDSYSSGLSDCRKRNLQGPDKTRRLRCDL